MNKELRVTFGFEHLINRSGSPRDESQSYFFCSRHKLPFLQGTGWFILLDTTQATVSLYTTKSKSPMIIIMSLCTVHLFATDRSSISTTLILPYNVLCPDLIYVRQFNESHVKVSFTFSTCTTLFRGNSTRDPTSLTCDNEQNDQ